MGGIAALVSHMTGADEAPERAANVQANAAAQAAQLQNNQFWANYDRMTPWYNAGTRALDVLNQGLEPGGQFYKTMPTMEDLQMDPSYKWRMQEGVNALAASGAAAGNYGSGNMGVALQQFGQNLASTEYSNAYNRWVASRDTLYNRLAGISGTGQSTTTQMANLGAQNATNVGNLMMQGANATANGILGTANMWNTTATNMSNQAMSGLGTYLKWRDQQNLYNQFGSYGAGMGGSYGYGGEGFGGMYNG